MSQLWVLWASTYQGVSQAASLGCIQWPIPQVYPDNRMICLMCPLLTDLWELWLYPKTTSGSKWPSSLPAPEEPLASRMPKQSCHSWSVCLLGIQMLVYTEKPDITALLALDSTNYGSWLKTTETNSGWCKQKKNLFNGCWEALKLTRKAREPGLGNRWEQSSLPPRKTLAMGILQN